MHDGTLITNAKGRFAETIVSTMLEHAGYRVLRLGVEETVSEVKASTARGEPMPDLPQQLRLAPDLLVVEPVSGRSTLVEVKYRSVLDDQTAAALHSRLTRQVACWPSTVTVIVSAGSAPANGRVDIRDFVRCLREQDLNRLVESHERLSRWQRLRTLGGVFERVLERETFYAEAARLIAPIKAWR